MRYRMIIFDFFGVISSEVAIVWFKKHFSGKEAEELTEEYVGPVDLGDVSEEQLFAKLGQMTSLAPEMIRQEWLALARIDQSVIDFIKRLTGKYKLAILSDAPSLFIREIIATNQLDVFFDKIIVSSEVHMTKAGKDIFRLALDDLGTSAAETVMIDDNQENIKIAESVGIKGFTFANLAKLEESLSGVGILAQ